MTGGDSRLLPLTPEPTDRLAVCFGDRELTYRELVAAAGALSPMLSATGRVAVWETSTAETVVAVVGAQDLLEDRLVNGIAGSAAIAVDRVPRDVNSLSAAASREESR